ncbi:MAG: GNAT family N-acetyltransferase [Gemmatales bacterium]|nr:GNAT family N-acetyltransferase [Gemmatales bacterium]MDW7993299.1 GNAT family N-acetyltransferase [Gemmatales bacterium]
MVWRIRPFRNPDPPQLVRLWNLALVGRGAAVLPHVNCLEQGVLSKPYFDPKGLLVAERDGQLLGWVHAGFGPGSTGQRLSTEQGVICVLLVHPQHRRQGLGTELLHRAEQYLLEHGAREIYFGAHNPLRPFYWGLYGGSEPSGILESDTDARPFLEKRGYQIVATHIVYQRILDGRACEVAGPAATWKAQCTLQVIPKPLPSDWFEVAASSPLEIVRFQFVHRGQVLAHVDMWEMELFGWRWKQPTVGLLDLSVSQEHASSGVKAALLAQSLEYLEEQYYTLVEMHVPESAQHLRRCLRDLGFEMIDRALVYRRNIRP